MSTTEKIEDLRENVLPFRPFEAMETAEALTRSNPNDAECHFFLATIYKSLNRHEDAAAMFEKSYALEGGAYMALFNAGICFGELGRQDDALTYYDRAAEAAGADSILAGLIGGLTVHRKGDPDEAIARYQPLLKRAPTNASLLYCLMGAERDRANHSTAEQHARQIRKGFGRYPESGLDLVTFHQGYDYAGWKAWADKDAFVNSVRGWCAATERNWPDFLPATYILPSDRQVLEQSAKIRENPIWIVKSTTLSASVGTHLINDISHLKDEPNWIVQDYIANPYLIKGRKFALRLYLLVSSYDPPRAYLFQGGTAKIALRKYTTDPESFHLTSVHTEHTRPDRHRTDLKAELAADVGEKGWWTVDQLFLFLEREGLDPAEIWNQARNIATTLIDAMATQGFFRAHAPDGIRAAYGPKFVAFDLVLDENAKLWLSELERGPTYNRVFNSDGTEAETFNGLAKMAIYSLGEELDPDVQVALAKSHEDRHRGRFALIYG
ncbi:MAG: hypothetical protein CMM48_15455 [Rhodospirillaceae bacterium]|nr:hypothetical protein [Rhodospirillaceae bacterium]